MGTKMEIGGEAMHLRSRDPWYEAHAALCAKRRPPLAMPPLLEIANVKLATLSHWQHSQPPALRPIKIKISRKSLYNATKFHTLLEVSPRKFHQRRKSFNKNCSTTKISNAGQIMQKITLNSQLVSTHIFHNVFRTFTTSGIVSRDTAPTVPR